MKRIFSVEWIPDSDKGVMPGHVRILDQTRLPTDVQYLNTTHLEEIWQAIKRLQVRGAPAIGIAAAMGLAAVAQDSKAQTSAELLQKMREAADYLATSRPTAVNLFWALDRMMSFGTAMKDSGPNEIREALIREAIAIRDEDAAMCRAIGEHGAALINNGDTVLTHCNAGGLATSEFGTALAPVYVAHAEGRKVRVYADETRPLLQGARLTAWELMQAGIDVTLICDNMAAQVMKEGRICSVMVGADRIAANGDAANKIGTYGVAVLAKAHNIPFYVLAPSSTFDLSIQEGDAIPIEERSPDEVVCGFGKVTAPEGVRVYSPAFDVTPASLITAIVCEKGIARPDFRKSIASLIG